MTLKSAAKAKNDYQNIILVGLIAIVLFIESVMTLLSYFRKGILKKQVLTGKTNLGFDFKIIMKN